MAAAEAGVPASKTEIFYENDLLILMIKIIGNQYLVYGVHTALPMQEPLYIPI